MDKIPEYIVHRRGVFCIVEYRAVVDRNIGTRDFDRHRTIEQILVDKFPGFLPRIKARVNFREDEFQLSSDTPA